MWIGEVSTAGGTPSVIAVTYLTSHPLYVVSTVPIFICGWEKWSKKGQKLAHGHMVIKRQNQDANLDLLFPDPVLSLLCCTSATLDSNQFTFIDYFVSSSPRPRLNGERKKEWNSQPPALFIYLFYHTLGNITLFPQRQATEKCCFCSLSDTHEVRVIANTWCFQNMSHLQKH